MQEKNRIQSRLGLLLLIPVFILYVNHSLLIYHSHIFSGETVITHSHSLNDCAKQVPENEKQPTGDHTIVLHSLWLALDNATYFNFQDEIKSTEYKNIILPVVRAEYSEYITVRLGRAPPIIPG